MGPTQVVPTVFISRFTRPPSSSQVTSSGTEEYPWVSSSIVRTCS